MLVNLHLPTLAPSLKAGKDIYVEWCVEIYSSTISHSTLPLCQPKMPNKYLPNTNHRPLGKNLQEAEELLRLKNEGKVKHAVVGLQAREAPILHELKALLANGRIGKVLSSTWVGNANNGGEQELVESMTRLEVGGNLATIHMGHALDYVQFGESLLLSCFKL